MYQALYRKYRPRRFSDVAGQQHVTETLRRQVMSDKLSHAYLFIGTRGTGKTTCARILSRAVNCMNPIDGNPCNECPSCKGIEEGTLLDVVELDAASNNGVDDVRQWRHDVIYSPATAKKRVFIVDEVHMLSKEAFNALLKILEEPPGHLIFILATTELHKVLPTIQSRCQKFMFKRLPQEEIAARLLDIAKSEKLALAPEAAALLARLADGSMRDGISLLDQCASDKEIDLGHVRDTLGLIADDGIIRLVKAIAANNTIDVLDTVDKLYKDGKDMSALVSELSAVLRDILVVSLAPGSPLISSGIPASELSAMSKLMPAGRLLGCLDIAKDTLQSLSRTGISKPVLEMCLIRMSNESLSGDHAAPRETAAAMQDAASPTAEPTAPAREDAPPAITVAPPPAPAPPQTPPSAPDAPLPAPIPPQTTLTTPVPPQTPPSASDIPPSVPAASTVAAPPPTSGDNLPEILGNIDDASLRVFLNDSSKAHAKINNGMLVISMTDEYNASLIRTSFMDALSEAALKTYGREMSIRIDIESAPDADKQSKLESLMSFGDIVTIE